MDVLEAIRTRRSIRAYKQDPVPEASIEQMLEAGRWAPSASNEQPWEFITFADPDIKGEVSRCFRYGGFLADAPLGIMVLVDPAAGSPIEDGTLAAYAIMLAAHGLGLGTCWIHHGTEDEDRRAKEILAIPDGRRIICVLSVGYPAGPATKDRKALADIVHRGQYTGR